MATTTFTKTLSESSITEFINDLEGVRAKYDNEEEQAFAASMIFTWFGIIGGPAAVCTIAAITTGALAYYYDTLQNGVTSAITELNKYKDYLQDHDEFDLIKLEMTCDIVDVNGETAYVPKDFNVIALHTTSGGWLMFQ